MLAETAAFFFLLLLLVAEPGEAFTGEGVRQMKNQVGEGRHPLRGNDGDVRDALAQLGETLLRGLPGLLVCRENKILEQKLVCVHHQHGACKDRGHVAVFLENGGDAVGQAAWTKEDVLSAKAFRLIAAIQTDLGAGTVLALETVGAEDLRGIGTRIREETPASAVDIKTGNARAQMKGMGNAAHVGGQGIRHIGHGCCPFHW